MPRLHVNGITLHYERGGAGEPVVFVHGGFANLATRLASLGPWMPDSWETDIAQRFDFVLYDRRGCYRSDSPPDGYEIDSQARDLAELLLGLGMAPAHLIGSSAGGPISVICAAMWPDRVRSLVLAGTALQLFPPDDPFTPVICQLGEVLRRDGPEAAFAQRPSGVEATYDSLWGHTEAQARGRLESYLTRERYHNERAQTVALPERVRLHTVELRNMLAYIESDLRPHAERIACPTLVLHGRDDLMVPLSHGEELARAIPGAELLVLDGEGHSVVHRTRIGRRAAMDWIDRQTPTRQPAL